MESEAQEEDRPLKLLITGATGFVGALLASKLAKRYDVYAISRKDKFSGHKTEGVDYVEGDLVESKRIAQIFDMVRPEIVVHMGAYTPVRFSFEEPNIYGSINYTGTVNMVQGAVKQKVRQFVYASTAEVYGPHRYPMKDRESDQPMPTSPYSVSKLAGELYVRYAASMGLRHTIMRCTNTYGRTKELPADEARGYLIEKLVIQMLRADPVKMDGYPNSKRRFMHVDDHVSAYLAVIDKEKAFGETFNAAPEKTACSLYLPVKMIREMTGYSGEVDWGYSPRPIDPSFLDPSPRKIKDMLGWTTKVSLEDGLKRTVDYWKS